MRLPDGVVLAQAPSRRMAAMQAQDWSLFMPRP
jgi:hypothetical protein